MEIKVEKPSQDKLDQLKVTSWGVWEKDISRFNWFYDEKEMCYFLKGEVTIETEDGRKVDIEKGDFVEFPEGLRCIWDIKKAVKKHYKFG